ncbi:hypothetical protein I350_07044 [Cryptococcus amylolentus CBS 6273]|uniref:Uncharacterized protein n=1 Tax=Cryptococcus amylolentus CBS 6273 TaxID=1296118 RepID=A0A1E3JHN1_9TREE|nr:hypothetical protein I350_07044 [Cryptococcus amylolentus CBS 6273]
MVAVEKFTKSMPVPPAAHDYSGLPAVASYPKTNYYPTAIVPIRPKIRGPKAFTMSMTIPPTTYDITYDITDDNIKSAIQDYKSEEAKLDACPAVTRRIIDLKMKELGRGGWEEFATKKRAENMRIFVQDMARLGWNVELAKRAEAERDGWVMC